LIRYLFSPEFTFTKRLLGLHLIIVGVAGNAVMIGWDLVRQSEHGIGPQQKAAMIVLAVGVVIGLTLLPLCQAKA
jgi:purine-cytosine permease-like protein